MNSRFKCRNNPSTDIPTALDLSSMIILSILSVSLLKLVFHLCYEREDIWGTKC